MGAETLSGRLRRPWVAFALLVASSPASASVDLGSSTFLLLRPERQVEGLRTTVPLLERVSLRALDLGGDALPVDVVVSAWAGVDPTAPEGERVASGDVELAFAEGRLLDQRLSLRLGRQLVIAGVGRAALLDGLQATVQLGKGVGVTAFGGATVAPRFGVSRGDAAAGGRVFWRYNFETEVGASAISTVEDGLVARQEVGLDARWSPVERWNFYGAGFWSTYAERLSEGELSATYRPTDAVIAAVDYRRISPDLFLPYNSIFSVFAMDSRDEAGLSASWALERNLGLSADYHAFFLPEGVGHRGGVRAALGRAPGGLLVGELRGLSHPSNGFVQARARRLQPLTERLFLTFDGEVTWFRAPVNGERFSFNLFGTAVYELAQSWRLALTGVGTVSPLFTRRLELVARLAYEFGGGARPWSR